VSGYGYGRCCVIEKHVASAECFCVGDFAIFDERAFFAGSPSDCRNKQEQECGKEKFDFHCNEKFSDETVRQSYVILAQKNVCGKKRVLTSFFR